MAIADREQRLVDHDRQIERRALHEFLVVEIAAVAARRQRRDHSPLRRRRDRHHAEEWRERQIESPRQPAGVLLPVERNVDQRVLGEIIRQRTRERADHVVAPVVVKLNVLDPHLEHLPRLRALHGDRPGADVARHLLRHALVNRRKRRRHGERCRRHLARHARHGGDRDRVAARNGEQRLQPRVEIAPVHRLRRGIETVMCHMLPRELAVTISEK